MVKVLELNTDRIRFRKPSGETRLDTDFGLFHIVGPQQDGSMSMGIQGAPTVPAASTPASDATTDYTIATGINPACTDVVGAIYFGVDSGNAVAFNRWTSYMGGTIVWVFTGALTLPVPGLAMSYSFFLDGSGNLIMRQQYRVRAAAFGWQIRAHTIQWKLKTGLWT